MQAGMQIGANLGFGMDQSPQNVMGNAPTMAQDLYGMAPGQAAAQAATMPGGMSTEELLAHLQRKANLTPEEQQMLDYLMQSTGAQVPQFGQMMPDVEVSPMQQAGEAYRDTFNAGAQAFGEARQSVADKKNKFLDWWKGL